MSDDVKKLRAYAARLEREIVAANEQIEALNEEQVYLRNELAFVSAEKRAWNSAFSSVEDVARRPFSAASSIRTRITAAKRAAKKEIADAL